MPGSDEEAGSDRRTAIPAAFYHDAAPPPRDDPHWVEFGDEDASDSLPDWWLLAVPVVLLAVMVLHGVLALVLYLLLHH